MKRNFELMIINIKYSLMRRRISFFSQSRFEDYLNNKDLNEGLQALIQLYPYSNILQKPEDSLVYAIQEVANSYHNSNVLRRFWLRLTTSIGVYLDLANILMVTELEAKVKNLSVLNTYKATISSYKGYYNLLRPNWLSQLINNWHHKLNNLMNEIKMEMKSLQSKEDFEFQKKLDECARQHRRATNPLYQFMQGKSISLLISDIIKALESKGSNLAVIVKNYQLFKVQYPDYDSEELKKLERRIALALHPDKNKQQEELATNLFKEFYSIKNGTKIETNEGLSSTRWFDNFKAELDKQDERMKSVNTMSEENEAKCVANQDELEKLRVMINHHKEESKRKQEELIEKLGINLEQNVVELPSDVNHCVYLLP